MNLSPKGINHEETKSTKKDQKKTFVLFVSSWLIPIVLGRRHGRHERIL